jgi:SSS family solute:Na+ symporter
MNWFVTIGGIAYNVIIIFAVYIWISYRRKKTGVEEDFVLSNRKLPWLAVAATQALTALGGGHINGLTFQSWNTGVATIWYCIGTGLMFLFILRFNGIWYRRLGCVTLNDMFGKMFHPILTPILGGIGVGYCWAILCVETQGMATVISSLTGLSNLAGAIIGAVVGILYVYLAGMKEIAYVNIFNAVLMYVFGIIMLIYLNFSIPNGWTAINNSILASNPDLLRALGNPEILRTYVIGTFLACALGPNMAQANLQSAAAVDNVKVLRKACTMAIPMNVLFGIIILSLGLASLALPEPAATGNGASGVVLMTLMYMPGWLQICVIGVFLAAMLSTFAMVALSLATMINRDLLSNFSYFKNMSIQKEKAWSRTWILVGSITAMIGAVAIKASVNMGLTWAMACLVPLFFIFVIGMNWKRSGKGAIATLVCCLLINMLLTFTNLSAVFHLEGNNYSIFMCVCSTVLCLFFTALDKNRKESYRKEYMRQRAEYDAKRQAAKM